VRFQEREEKTMERLGSSRPRVAVLVAAALAACAATLVAATGASASTTTSYQATYVEPFPPSAPCPGSCGWASISGFGHAPTQVAEFNVYGLGVHRRTVTFADGATLVIRITDMPCAFCFVSPGSSGNHPWSPMFLEIEEEILGGTGRLTGASGSGSGTVKLHGGVAIGKTSGSITLP
jgi:hypothetical protein